MGNLRNHLILLLIFFLLSGCKDDDTPGNERPTSLYAAIFDEVNNYRKTQGLSILEKSTFCDQLALGHSTDMATGSVPFGHEGFIDRFDAAHEEIGANSAGENVANNFFSGSDVVNAWIKRVEHNKNLVGDFTHVGYGIAEDADGNLFITQFLVKI